MYIVALMQRIKVDYLSEAAHPVTKCRE